MRTIEEVDRNIDAVNAIYAEQLGDWHQLDVANRDRIETEREMELKQLCDELAAITARQPTLRTIDEVDAEIEALRSQQERARVSYRFSRYRRRRRIKRLELEANAITALNMAAEKGVTP